MRNLFIIAVILISVVSCKKDTEVQNIDVQGYWNVLRDTSFTSIPANATADLFHLFRSPHAFYRLSFLKTHDFSNVNSRPRTDSLISMYKVEGNQLLLTNGAPSVTNNLAGNMLISRTDDEMVFTRTVVLRRSTLDGKVTLERTDTIRYQRVKDPVKVAYFDNYLKTYHP
ncbi:MAG: hypothetical protein ACO25B_13245 [Chitinophagaceae bacterium]